MIYYYNINRRFQSFKPLIFKVEDFERLNCTKYKFPSGMGQILARKLYSIVASNKETLLSHMNLAAVTILYGLYQLHCVTWILYIRLRCDMKWWKRWWRHNRWFPQAVIDLDYAISFIEDMVDFIYAELQKKIKKQIICKVTHILPTWKLITIGI